MALIKCAECGKEISDKAAACIHCGCPITAAVPANNTPRSLSVNFNAVVSGTDGGTTAQTVYVAELGRNVEFPMDNNIKVGETVKVTLREGSEYDSILFKVVSVSLAGSAGGQTDSNAVSPASSAGRQTDSNAVAMIKKYKPNLLVRFFKSGVIGKTMGMLLTFIVAGRFTDADAEVLAPIVAGLVVLMLLGSTYPMANVKRYYKKHHIDEAIRKDTDYMNVAIAAYNNLPGRKMLKYIRELNPAAAIRIERQLAEKK